MIDALILLMNFLLLAIFARVIVSWLVAARALSEDNVFARAIFQITEPILGPLRRVIPRVGMFDFSPMFAMLALVAIAAVLSSAR